MMTRMAMAQILKVRAATIALVITAASIFLSVGTNKNFIAYGCESLMSEIWESVCVRVVGGCMYIYIYIYIYMYLLAGY